MLCFAMQCYVVLCCVVLCQLCIDCAVLCKRFVLCYVVFCCLVLCQVLGVALCFIIIQIILIQERKFLISCLEFYRHVFFSTIFSLLIYYTDFTYVSLFLIIDRGATLRLGEGGTLVTRY